MGSKNKWFAKFRMFYNHPIVIKAELRKVTNSNNKNFGLVHIWTDLNFNPISDHPDYADYLAEETAIKILLDLEFVSIKEGFDHHNIEDLREVKNQIPTEWIESYNSWTQYKG
jgi:hypothetical protein